MASLQTQRPMSQSEAQPFQRSKKKAQGFQYILKNSFWNVILVLGAIVSLFPYYLAFLTYLKASNQIFAGASWSLPASPTLAAYVTILTQYNFPGYIVQTLIFAAVSTIGQLVFSTLAAYAFGRMQFRGRDTLFWLYLAPLIVPNILPIIHSFLLISP